MQTIVAAVDFSDLTEAVVATAAEVASALGGRVVLFHLSPLVEPWVDTTFDRYTIGRSAGPEYAEVEAKLREQMLSQLRASIAAQGIEASVYVAIGDRPAAVCEQLASLNPDLIVVGSHRHGLLHAWLYGGVCPRLVRRAPCPVTIVHKDDPPLRRVQPAKRWGATAWAVGR